MVTKPYKIYRKVKSARIWAAVFLGLMGIAACYGGAALVIDSSGETLGLSVSLLSDTNFDSYFTPGLILFFALGMLSLLSFVFTIIDHKYYPNLIFNQGFIVIGWIMMQVYLLKIFHYLQLVVGVIGILLGFLGVYIKKWK
ncbi:MULTISPECIES: hypothetical protein [unclassified Imperialibacter]|uniref:hypothetical protein n=1 Tax=unclassified Imperialibacter TaxID=2629706 RepID=UPI00125BBEE4|nr:MULTISPECIES: hypothetical protein [unclassified Imperialibacter]CAD5279780.1 conserved membrane hypothetical protein [Imperialibacter sp. 75]CAD5288471.1 conserved membrane hypothetical protein [Imperialibacter sp. 89]VVT15921.1 conserved membrane hypothetical protein [Imperialibacter sp. EC-SDR9]